MDFKEKVFIVRANLGLTQEKLAKELNVSFATINRWETGKFSPSKIDEFNFYSYCKKKNIKVED